MSLRARFDMPALLPSSFRKCLKSVIQALPIFKYPLIWIPKRVLVHHLTQHSGVFKYQNHPTISLRVFMWNSDSGWFSFEESVAQPRRCHEALFIRFLNTNHVGAMVLLGPKVYDLCDLIAVSCVRFPISLPMTSVTYTKTESLNCRTIVILQ